MYLVSRLLIFSSISNLHTFFFYCLFLIFEADLVCTDLDWHGTFWKMSKEIIVKITDLEKLGLLNSQNGSLTSSEGISEID